MVSQKIASLLQHLPSLSRREGTAHNDRAASLPPLTPLTETDVAADMDTADEWARRLSAGFLVEIEEPTSQA